MLRSPGTLRPRRARGGPTYSWLSPWMTPGTRWVVREDFAVQALAEGGNGLNEHEKMLAVTKATPFEKASTRAVTNTWTSCGVPSQTTSVSLPKELAICLPDRWETSTDTLGLVPGSQLTLIGTATAAPSASTREVELTCIRGAASAAPALTATANPTLVRAVTALIHTRAVMSDSFRQRLALHAIPAAHEDVADGGQAEGPPDIMLVNPEACVGDARVA